ncbi:NAD(P)-linked oxidoreductase superfamily protein [Abeliophyllum distichum]|uniref:NAD(P)-linked oxidoreductase superfamily protein n=1 Tax=Abeliophyllum distichum TaxID=126358 RepID=A0ABD1PFM3_9LAMI
MATMKIPQALLNSGNLIPTLGFGTTTYPMPPPEQLTSILMDAVEAGYRHFDTAAPYGTEELRPDIAEGIQMFQPKSLKEVFSLARMRDDQLLRQQRFTRAPPINRHPLNLPSPVKSQTTVPMKRLTWEEMQRRRA